MSSWDDLEKTWRDLHAKDREHSHVSSDTYKRIDEMIAATIKASAGVGLAGAPTELIARLIVDDLEDAALEEIVRDWLEGLGRGM